jgi:hypothetical protein
VEQEDPDQPPEHVQVPGLVHEPYTQPCEQTAEKRRNYKQVIAVSTVVLFNKNGYKKLSSLV